MHGENGAVTNTKEEGLEGKPAGFRSKFRRKSNYPWARSAIDGIVAGHGKFVRMAASEVCGDGRGWRVPR